MRALHRCIVTASVPRSVMRMANRCLSTFDSDEAQGFKSNDELWSKLKTDDRSKFKHTNRRVVINTEDEDEEYPEDEEYGEDFEAYDEEMTTGRGVYGVPFTKIDDFDYEFEDDVEYPLQRQGGRFTRRAGMAQMPGAYRGTDDINEDFMKGDDERIPMDGLTPAVLATLCEHEWFEETSRSGEYDIDTTGMDPLDAFIAEAYFHSFKTDDGSYMVQYDNVKRKRMSTPIARPLSELVRTLEPALTSVDPAVPMAEELAKQAWLVLQANNYYTEAQKAQFLSGIVSSVNDVYNTVNKMPDVILYDAAGKSESPEDDEYVNADEKGVPEAWSEEPVFEHGYLRRGKAVNVSDVEKEDYGKNKGETNWDVEAVFDEDDL